MEHNDVSNLSLAILGAEIFRFVIRTTDLKDTVFKKNFRLNLGDFNHLFLDIRISTF